MRTSALAFLLLLAACLPPEPPEWQIGAPTFLGIQTAVVADGPYVDGLTVLPGHVRANPLPLDTLEWRWFGAAPEGESFHPPLWIRCAIDCNVEFPAALEDCASPLPVREVKTCRLGVGQRLRRRIGDLDTIGPGKSVPGVSVMALTSISDDPEVCLARLRQEPRPDLGDCLYTTTFTRFAPILWMQSLLGGNSDNVSPAMLHEAPDTNPTVSFEVVHASAPMDVQVAVDGDVVAVRAGEPVSVRVVPGEGSLQEYFYDPPFRIEEEGTIETLTIETWLVGGVDDYAEFGIGDAGFTVPSGAVRLIARVADGRSGVGFATLELDAR